MLYVYWICKIILIMILTLFHFKFKNRYCPSVWNHYEHIWYTGFASARVWTHYLLCHSTCWARRCYIFRHSFLCSFKILSCVFIFIFLDLKLHLQSTDYGNFLANEPSPLTVSVIDDKLKEKLVVEFQHLRNQCVEPLSTFLDYIT